MKSITYIVSIFLQRMYIKYLILAEAIDAERSKFNLDNGNYTYRNRRTRLRSIRNIYALNIKLTNLQY